MSLLVLIFYAPDADAQEPGARQSPELVVGASLGNWTCDGACGLVALDVGVDWALHAPPQHVPLTTHTLGPRLFAFSAPPGGTAGFGAGVAHRYIFQDGFEFDGRAYRGTLPPVYAGLSVAPIWTLQSLRGETIPRVGFAAKANVGLPGGFSLFALGTAMPLAGARSLQPMWGFGIEFERETVRKLPGAIAQTALFLAISALIVSLCREQTCQLFGDAQ